MNHCQREEKGREGRRRHNKTGEEDGERKSEDKIKKKEKGVESAKTMTAEINK